MQTVVSKEHFEMKNMNKLFQNLIWPAVAGNVAWAFFSIAITENWTDKGVLPRLLSLLLLAIYLCYDWTTTDVEGDNLKKNYWIGDAFHTSAIVIFAIAAQSKNLWISIDDSWVKWALVIVFSTSVIGHLCGSWEPSTVKSENLWSARFKLAGINLLGIIFYIFIPLLIESNSLWHLPISIIIVLLFWFHYSNKVYR